MRTPIGYTHGTVEDTFFEVFSKLTKRTTNSHIESDTVSREEFNQYYFNEDSNSLMRGV